MSYSNSGNTRPSSVAAGLVAILMAGLLLVAVLAGLWFGIKGMTRYQKANDAENKAKIARINAENEARVNELRIKAQEQRVKIAEQEAQIRYVEATGIKRAQDEIAKTLTPLYVQHEWIEAYKANPAGTTVYIPSAEGGVPTVRTTP